MSRKRKDGGTACPLCSSTPLRGFATGKAEYDEDGSLALARALRRIGARRKSRAEPGSAAAGAAADSGASVADLDGSWYLRLTSRSDPGARVQVRGPMRIEVAVPKLRVSGDIYVRHLPAAAALESPPIVEHSLLFDTSWYPQLPPAEYSWYFRSLGVTLQAGTLVFRFERHLWNRTTQEFVPAQGGGVDNGMLEFDCAGASTLSDPALPQPAVQIRGTAQIGGETYDAVATKTSPLYRGCAFEVDVMARRAFPLSVSTVAGAAISFESIYRAAGIDTRVVVDQHDIPEDGNLSTVELQAALGSNRRPVVEPDAWRLWLFVGSADTGGSFGIMFDDAAPFREGACGFFDPRLGDDAIVAAQARNRKLGEVPEAFLRTLLHEAGHALNLFHPKHDVHSVPLGTTLMNQTGDVMGFASPAQPYPNNISFAFDEHNRSSLVHSPDPQVAPGWKRFGWGHGNLSDGISEPIDALGFAADGGPPGGLVLELRLPEVVFRGQFVAAEFTLINQGTAPRSVTAALNLSQGDLRLVLTPPHEGPRDVRDVVVACGDRPLATLAPGESMQAVAQVFYTSVGHTFRQTGRHWVSAELDVGDGSSGLLRSTPVAIVVRAPVTAEEEQIASLSMTTGVGRAFAFGDPGFDDESRASLEELAARHAGSDNGIAAAMTLANAHGRALRNLKTGVRVREADANLAAQHFDRAAAQAGDAMVAVRTAAAVAAPTEANAPVLDMADAWLGQAAAAADVMAADTAGDASVAARTAPPGLVPATSARALLRSCRRSMARGQGRSRT